MTHQPADPDPELLDGDDGLTPELAAPIAPSVWARRDRERHRLPALRAPSEYVVFSVDQLDKYLVLTGRQTRHADCIVVTRLHPTPGAGHRRVCADARSVEIR
jgi:hypothetical protein